MKLNPNDQTNTQLCHQAEDEFENINDDVNIALHEANIRKFSSKESPPIQLSEPNTQRNKIFHSHKDQVRRASNPLRRVI
jgi:hypothetical protein